MEKFKLKACTIDYFESEIEAENLEAAKKKFEEKWEAGDIQNPEGTALFFSDEEGFDELNEIYESLDSEEE